ncbi:tRNA pseudouridine(38-40) synthase TruA [Chitinilyticum piscinae]|uniref:tRNA pseudouridine synthase A n=1 Tax=Chitinilyticum piscinae TaxID=2866724 RepID=A0A8J7K1S3_9NEIS|nr:tRNA pseudouridine(38-40) synthase TruA [Chitinilyticum piscinae]MBE9609626.1 tRNA pseudouridine(38-40) synthase TruA [Chitinilyticum piscinae]
MQRYALGIEYDGRAFNGWQIQPDRPTVQDALETAISKMAGHEVRIHAAGRTDAGVHATGQVCHFDSAAPRPLTAWVRGVNSFLPEGVAVTWSRTVPEHFHARFLAMARHYRYLVLNHPVRPALLAGRIGWAHQKLDVAAMQLAADRLLGEHDFSSFRAAECQAPSPVKLMHAIRIRQDGHLLCFDFSASAFLHHMVRNIMGALLHIGKGNQPAEWMSELLAWRDRSLAPPTFMPDGLYLSGVSYPAEFELPSEPAQRYGLL